MKSLQLKNMKEFIDNAEGWSIDVSPTILVLVKLACCCLPLLQGLNSTQKIFDIFKEPLETSSLLTYILYTLKDK